jgi:glycosyltransferase involved in cell wall biosynthesis
VIGTLCTGSRDAVIPEVTGLLVPPGHPQSISEAALRLIRDLALRLELGNAARKWVVGNYENKRVLAMAIDFYLGMIEPAKISALPSGSNLDRRATGSPAWP